MIVMCDHVIYTQEFSSWKESFKVQVTSDILDEVMMASLLG